jgi:hypothetical protein
MLCLIFRDHSDDCFMQRQFSRASQVILQLETDGSLQSECLETTHAKWTKAKLFLAGSFTSETSPPFFPH